MTTSQPTGPNGVPSTSVERAVVVLGVFAVGWGLFWCLAIGATIVDRLRSGEPAQFGDLFLVAFAVPFAVFGVWSLITGYCTLRTDAPPRLRSLSAILAAAVGLAGSFVLADLMPRNAGLDTAMLTFVLDLVLLNVSVALYVGLSQTLLCAQRGEPFRISIPPTVTSVIGLATWLLVFNVFNRIAEDRMRAGDANAPWWNFAALCGPIIIVVAVVKLLSRWEAPKPFEQSFRLTRSDDIAA